MTLPRASPFAALGIRGVYGHPADGGSERAAEQAAKLRAAGVAVDDYATTDTDGSAITVTRIRPTASPVALTGDWTADPEAVFAQALAALEALGIVDTTAVEGL